MKTLVAYTSKNGFTERCAQMLKDRLGQEVTLVNLSKSSTIDLSNYDCVALGGSIYAGKTQPELTKFCQDNVDTLMGKRLGLFLCCANVDQVDQQMAATFDARLIQHAVAKEHLGYEFDFDKLNFMMKMIVRAVAKVTKSETRIMDENLQRLAEALR